MKQLIICLCGLLWGARLLAAEPLVSGTFLTHAGVYQATNTGVVRELTIQTNKLWLNAVIGQQSSDAGSFNWVAAHHWFVYVAQDMRIWAYNGEHFLILLQADARSSRTVPLEYLPEQPPRAVFKRLPRAMRKLLSAHPSSQANRDAAADGSQPISRPPFGLGAYKIPTNLANQISGADRIIVTNAVHALSQDAGFSLVLSGNQAKAIVRAISSARCYANQMDPGWPCFWELQFYKASNHLATVSFLGHGFEVDGQRQDWPQREIYDDETGLLAELYSEITAPVAEPGRQAQ